MNYQLETILNLKLGVPDEERKTPQDVVITVEFECKTDAAERSDDVADCPINYQDMYDLIHSYSEKEFRLIESLHYSLLRNFESQFSEAQNLILKICKKPWNNGSVKIF